MSLVGENIGIMMVAWLFDMHVPLLALGIPNCLLYWDPNKLGLNVNF